MAEVDMQAIVEKWRLAVATQLDQMKVRQWCIEQVIKFVEASNADVDLVDLAGDLLVFVTTPLNETFKAAPDTAPPASPAVQTVAHWPAGDPPLSTKLSQ